MKLNDLYPGASNEAPVMALELNDVSYPISFTSDGVGVLTFYSYHVGEWDNGAITSYNLGDYINLFNKFGRADYRYRMAGENIADRMRRGARCAIKALEYEATLKRANDELYAHSGQRLNFTSKADFRRMLDFYAQ